MSEWVFIQSADVPEGAIRLKPEVRISPNDRGFMFADGVYEVLRSYQGRLFCPREHFARLQRSLAGVRIEFPDFVQLEQAARELIARNGLEQCEATVYIQITRGAAPRQHGFPPVTVPKTVYMETARVEPVPEHEAEGVAVITVPDIRWARCDLKTVALLPNVLARQLAIDAGAYEAVLVREGVITEGTHTNVCAVDQGTVITHPQDNRVLPGITRDKVLELCPAIGIPVEERPIPEARLLELDELFLVGTITEIAGIVRVNGRVIGSGRPGPVTRRLYAAFQSYLRGA
jgi:D-alanine transaminase